MNVIALALDDILYGDGLIVKKRGSILDTLQFPSLIFLINLQ